MIAGSDNLVQKEKNLVRKYYREDLKKNPKLCRKGSKGGGHTEAERQLKLSQMVSDARKEFLANQKRDIWNCHVELGFMGPKTASCISGTVFFKPFLIMFCISNFCFEGKPL